MRNFQDDVSTQIWSRRGFIDFDQDITRLLGQALHTDNNDTDLWDKHVSPTTSPKCESAFDEHSEQIYFCTNCGYAMCDKCWKLVRTHAKDANAHEMSYLSDYDTVYNALLLKADDDRDSQDSKSAQGSDEQHDANNMWFGVSMSQKEPKDYILYEGVAYEKLMLAGPSSRPSTTSPSLVSFIGETGSGKSALIKLLIEFSSHHRHHQLEFPTPLVSLRESGRSTSSNVHLYADPSTFRKSTTILYADCEGIGGAENPTTAKQEERATHWPRSFRPTSIKWGDRQENGTEIKSRYYFTRTLYPRMLYIFSDVVVYVLSNDKSKDDMVLELIRWAHNATEKSYNKPVLPFLIVILNKQLGSPKQDFYEINTATEKFLKSEDVKNVHQNPRIRSEYTSKWQNAAGDTVINSGEDLLKCYFSDVAVVHLPDNHRPTKLHQQIDLLYDKLTEFSTKAQEERMNMQMRLTAASFPLYSRKAFEKFASSYQDPFDFSEAWFDLNPVAFQFKDSILSLAHMVSKNSGLRGIDLWESLVDFMASCFLLSSSRNVIQGAGGGVYKGHLDQLKNAIREYWDHFWPCEEPSPKDQPLPCVNSNRGHKFHQFGLKGSKRRGEMNTKYTFEQIHDRLRNMVQKRIPEIKSEASADATRLKQIGINQCISQNHLQYVKRFYEEKNLETLTSHSVCFSCLDTAPDRHLPCGHVICSACVLTMAASNGSVDTAVTANGFVELHECPLGKHGKAWAKPWVGVVKPNQAGVRILSLEGGGIRGIVELELMRVIQDGLCGVPLRDCFDLILGTSTGGIISLALGSLNKTVEECTQIFRDFAEKAFTPHRLESIPLVGSRLGYAGGQLIHKSRYKSKPFEEALQATFKDHIPLFGGPYQPGEIPIKVAVTSTTKEGQVLLLSNYNRKPGDVSLYRFHRPGPENELMLWEAARATSAAPTYFAPFLPTTSNLVLLDGGVYNNNPIKVAHSESKAIWPESRHRQPDILLSLGTGFETAELTTDSAPVVAEPVPIPKHHNSSKASKLNTSEYFQMLFKIQYDHLMNGMLNERAWHEWLGARAPENRDQHRYRRLNVSLEQSIELDEVKKLNDCRELVEKWVETETNKAAVVDTANQLLSSCFYYRFDKGDICETWDQRYRCLGTIECRLPSGKNSSTSKLGRYWKKIFEQSNFLPMFIVTETYPGAVEEKQTISKELVETMARDGEFHFEVTVLVSSKRAETQINLMLHSDQTKDRLFPISGFPRTLQDDYEDLDRESPPDSLFRRVRRNLGLNFSPKPWYRYSRRSMVL